MSQTRFRQVARLEKLAKPYLERRQRSKSQSHKFIRKQAFLNLANLSLLILYGEPKIDESLLTAWQRCLESAAWQACRDEHGGFDEYGRENGTPFDSLGASRTAEYFRKHFLPNLPGSDEKEKLDAIFERAPPWLLWFTHGDVCARILDISLPDLSSVSRFARGELTLFKLPHGPFEGHPLPDGVYDKFMVPNHENIKDKALDMTSRERKRMIRRLRAKPDKKIVDHQAAMPSS